MSLNKGLISRVHFICKPTSPECRPPQPPPSQAFYTLDHSLILCVYHPALGTRQLGMALISQSQAKLFTVTIPNPPYSASPVSSCRKHNRSHEARAFSWVLTLLPPGPGASPHGPTCCAMPHPLESKNVTGYLFNDKHCQVS